MTKKTKNSVLARTTVSEREREGERQTNRQTDRQTDIVCTKSIITKSDLRMIELNHSHFTN